MAHEVLRVPVIRTRSSASRRYLFFEHPPALWIADEKDEGHERILQASGRKNPVAAGWILAFSDELQVDATGSIDLHMPTKHPKSVCSYIASLPGKSNQQITEHGI